MEVIYFINELIEFLNGRNMNIQLPTTSGNNANNNIVGIEHFLFPAKCRNSSVNKVHRFRKTFK